MCFIISFNIPSGPDAFLCWRFLIFSLSSLSVIGKSNGFWLSLIVNSSFSNWLICMILLIVCTLLINV